MSITIEAITTPAGGGWMNAIPTTKAILTTDTMNASVQRVSNSAGEDARNKSALQLVVGARLAEEKEVICANSGNAHAMGQKPLTFVRQVLALCMAPFLLENPTVSNIFPVDAVARAKDYLSDIGSSPSSGAGPWADARGSLRIRQQVAQFISHEAVANAEVPGAVAASVVNPEHVFLRNGASDCVHLIMQSLLRGSNDAVLIPQQQSGLYTTSISLYGGSAVGYPLFESPIFEPAHPGVPGQGGWRLDLSVLTRALHDARHVRGLCVRALVLINPGCEVGQVLSAASIADLLVFCQQHQLVVIADEVYRDDYDSACSSVSASVSASASDGGGVGGIDAVGSKVLTSLSGTDPMVMAPPFVSVRRVLTSYCSPALRSSLQLLSIGSVSKGVFSEGGLRGGYFEAVNFDQGVLTTFYRLASAGFAPNMAGQVAVGLMVCPPVAGDASFVSHRRELSSIRSSLRRRSQIISNALSAMQNIRVYDSNNSSNTTSLVENANYGYIHTGQFCSAAVLLPNGALTAAAAAGLRPDEYYCLSLLMETGILVTPGSSLQHQFQQFPEYHSPNYFRMSLLMFLSEEKEEEEEEKKLMELMSRFTVFNNNFMNAHSAVTDTTDKGNSLAVEYMQYIFSGILRGNSNVRAKL